MSADDIVNGLARILAPLVEADEGELYAVEVTPKRVRLHLSGKFAGCPGNSLVTDRVIRPVVERLAPEAELQVTAGAFLPEGADRLRPTT